MSGRRRGSGRFGDGEQVRARVGDGVEERLRERVRASSSELGQRQSARAAVAGSDSHVMDHHPGVSDER